MPLSIGRENGVGQGRGKWRHTRLTDARWYGITLNDVGVDVWHLVDSGHLVIMEIALFNGPVLGGDFTIECQ